VLPIDVQYDRVIWSGLSWGAGEIRKKEITGNGDITIRCSSAEKGPVKLSGNVYVVTY
jgi:hypothetical protein